MNHDQGLNDLQESKVPASALNRSHSESIQNPGRAHEPGFAEREARDPVVGIPVKGKPNQILAGIPVYRLKQPSARSSAPGS